MKYIVTNSKVFGYRLVEYYGLPICSYPDVEILRLMDKVLDRQELSADEHKKLSAFDHQRFMNAISDIYNKIPLAATSAAYIRYSKDIANEMNFISIKDIGEPFLSRKANEFIRLCNQRYNTEIPEGPAL